MTLPFIDFTRWILQSLSQIDTLELRTSDPPFDTHVLINNLSKLRTLIVCTETTDQLARVSSSLSSYPPTTAHHVAVSNDLLDLRPRTST